MLLLALSLAFALEFGDSAQPTEIAEPTEATEESEESEEFEEIEEFDETSGTVQRRRVRKKPVQGDRGRRTEGLAVAALLGLLLLSRVNRRKRQERTRPPRRTPMTVAELGSSVFEAGRQADLFLYRDLFLTGGEVSEMFGREEADRWLARRTNDHLTESLAGLAVICRPGSFFTGARLEGEVLVLRTRGGDGEQERPVAVVQKVGTAFRLYDLVES